VERGGRPARLFGPAAAVRGLSGLHDLRRVRVQLAHAEEQLTAARTAVYRDIWTAAAERAGAHVRETEGGFLQVTRGEAVTLVRENLVELDTPAVLELTGDRVAANAYLARGGLPVTDSLGFTLADPRPALDFLRTHGRCVVKPAYGTGAGAGVTCDVQTLEDLVRAALSAVRYCPELVVERQLDGDEYRMLVLDGTVVGAVRRRPPSVVGDGGSTVTELVLAENRRRLAAGGHEGLFLLQLGLDACLTLRRQGLSPASVPGDGERVTVAGAVNTGAAADCEAVRPSPALAADAVAATRALGLRLASVEIATPLPDLGTAAPRAGVIEVNSTPGLTYHYHVRDPAGVQPVAEAVLDVLLRGRETVRAPRLRVSGRGGRGATTSDDAA
jgi:D-alanine-D-alanine ligase-like ATP-grasp enzyme